LVAIYVVPVSPWEAPAGFSDRQPPPLGHPETRLGVGDSLVAWGFGGAADDYRSKGLVASAVGSARPIAAGDHW